VDIGPEISHQLFDGAEHVSRLDALKMPMIALASLARGRGLFISEGHSLW
jgi:hypothetical protein